MKAIRTNAIVNESATERQIRELREENERLQGMIKKGGGHGGKVRAGGKLVGRPAR